MEWLAFGDYIPARVRSSVYSGDKPYRSQHGRLASARVEPPTTYLCEEGHHSVDIAKCSRSQSRREELTVSMKRRGIFAACVQGTWRSGKDTVEVNQCKLVLTGLDAKEQRSNRGSQGVGIALSPQAVDAWRAAGCELHDDLGARVIAVRLLMRDKEGKDIGIFLVSAYAPIGIADENLWENFFNSLDTCVARKHNGDILVIGADTNSSMGCSGSAETGNRATLGRFGLEHTNDSGRRFASYLAINNMLALTTCFKKKNYGTWIHPRSKLQHQLDHFLTIKDNSPSFTDAGVTQSLTDSDHRAVLCKLRLACRLKKRTSTRQRLLQLDYSGLKSDTIKDAFCQKVVEKYNAQPEDQPKYTKLATAVESVTCASLPRKSKPQPGWFVAAQHEINHLIQKRNAAQSKKFEKCTRSTTYQLRTARKDLKNAVGKAKSNWISETCNALNESSSAHGGTKTYWDTVGKLRNGLKKSQSCTERPMKKPDGTLCKTPEENAEVFKNHFQKLYGRQPAFDASVLEHLQQHNIVPNCDHTPDDEEITKATRRLKDRGPGDSGICPQAWKAIIQHGQSFSILKSVIIDFWESEITPAEWEIGLLKILAKKGDLSDPGNYRGIMLLETAYKIIAIILHDRLRPIQEGLKMEPQCGFCSGRGCTDCNFTVKIALKKRREHGLETWVLFLDLVKAFDRVPREMLWMILEKFGVPPKLIRLLKSLHANVQVKFTVNEVTNTIECIIGVKQGDILGPLLFLFFLEAVMITWRKLHERPLCLYYTKYDDILTGRRFNTKGEEFSLPDSEYADDTAVLFVSRESLVVSTPLLIAHFARFGLEIHVGYPDKLSKSEILFVAAPEHMYEDSSTYDGRDLSNVELGNGRYLPVVDIFKYLGSVLTRDCRDDADVDARINAASHAFGALRQCLFTSTEVSLCAKKVVYVGLILSILLYGSETWCLTEKLFNKLRVFHARCVRTMCRVTRLHTRLHRIRTLDLLKRLNVLSIDEYINRRQLRWLGHVARMDQERLPRKLLTSWVRNKRPRGAPQFTYGRGVMKALKKADIDKDKWYSAAQDRDAWRSLINR